MSRGAATAGVAAIVLAAGRSSRMGGPNKLLAAFDGVPLVRRVAKRALVSRAAETLVVTGHDAERIAAVLEGLPLRLVHNPDFASGLASSLRVGIAALSPNAAGALVVLSDMPNVGTADLDRLIAAFDAGQGAVVRATAGGLRGNPVILPRALFPEVLALTGDAGARRLIAGAETVEVELGPAALTDVDTPEAMSAAGGRLQG